MGEYRCDEHNISFARFDDAMRHRMAYHLPSVSVGVWEATKRIMKGARHRETS